MSVVVAKFGGTSLADAEQFKKVKEIVLADPARRYIVPSAPGKRYKDDIKVTDMLYSLHEWGAGKNPCSTKCTKRSSGALWSLGMASDCRCGSKTTWSRSKRTSFTARGATTRPPAENT